MRGKCARSIQRRSDARRVSTGEGRRVYDWPMSDKPINLEESEVTVAGPRDGSAYLYLLVEPSAKADGIRQDGLVTFRGALYAVRTKGETGTPGEPVQLALLKVDRVGRQSS